MKKGMKEDHIKARLARAYSGKSQDETAREVTADPSLIAQIELGNADPDRDLLQRLAGAADLTLPDVDDVFRHAEALRRSQPAHAREADSLFSELAGRLRTQALAAGRRLMRLSAADWPPRPEDRLRAAELVAKLARLSPRKRTLVVRMGREYQSWAVLELVCELSEQAASSDLEEAFAWARLARKIAARIRGPLGWRNRVKGFAEAFFANVLRVSGDLKRAEVVFAEAKKLWAAGSDPFGVLDPGVILDLEASLLRALRRFDESLDRLRDAEAVGRRRERALLKKGFTLEVMGEYERAVVPLLDAKPLVEQRGDQRMLYMVHFNLAVNFTHVGKFADAAALLEPVRALATKLKDEIQLNRVPWLEGRILAGLGQPRKARSQLQESRSGFEARGMGYDVALALLEEFCLLLDEGKTAEVKALAPDLAKVFESKGVHREALAALQLFREAVDREEATAELARRVLRFLFRAQHDEDVRFEG
jgi:transcriptional regulator with XRE-family HTH domain